MGGVFLMIRRCGRGEHARV